MDLNRIESAATKDGTAQIGSKKLIKSQFEYDLDQILAGGRSNCISLIALLSVNQSAKNT